jgi:hypothetical protein
MTILTINEKLRMRVFIGRCRRMREVDSWRFNVHSPLSPDVTIAARLAPGNASILDYFCIPSAKGRRYIVISRALVMPSDVQQFDDPTFLQDFAKWRRGRRGVSALSCHEKIGS